MTGDAILAHARLAVGRAYRLGVSVNLDDPDYWRKARFHGTTAPANLADDVAFDCAELGSWAIASVCNGLRAGCGPGGEEPFTGHWADASDPKRGTLLGCRLRRISVGVALVTPGAMLVRAPAAGIGGHLAVSGGNGTGSVEAYATAVGVVVRKDAHLRRWDFGVLVEYPYVAYRIGQPTRRPVAPPSVLRMGSSGPSVTALQMALLQRGFNPGHADGVFGVQTARAVREFQASAGLVPDAEVGPLTQAALRA